jgi:hypothetical protein
MFINCISNCIYQKDGTCTLNDIRNMNINFENRSNDNQCIYMKATPNLKKASENQIYSLQG